MLIFENFHFHFFFSMKKTKNVLYNIQFIIFVLYKTKTSLKKNVFLYRFFLLFSKKQNVEFRKKHRKTTIKQIHKIIRHFNTIKTGNFPN